MGQVDPHASERQHGQRDQGRRRQRRGIRRPASEHVHTGQAGDGQHRHRVDEVAVRDVAERQDGQRTGQGAERGAPQGGEARARRGLVRRNIAMNPTMASTVSAGMLEGMLLE